MPARIFIIFKLLPQHFGIEKGWLKLNLLETNFGRRNWKPSAKVSISKLVHCFWNPWQRKKLKFCWRSDRLHSRCKNTLRLWNLNSLKKRLIESVERIAEEAIPSVQPCIAKQYRSSNHSFPHFTSISYLIDLILHQYVSNVEYIICLYAFEFWFVNWKRIWLAFSIK